jgi:BASS family bile acid:Na+ symporter
MGYFLAKSFAFDPQIGAGIILIGACSSGLASNVMTYLAKANLTLSVTVTACATLLAPLMTPLLMKTLAGTMVDIDFWAMVSNIIKIVIFPIGAALLHDLLKSSSLAKSMIWRVFGFLSIIWLVLFNFGQVRVSVPFLSPTIVELVDLSAAAMLVGLAYHFAVSWRPSIQVIMPYISMLGIIYFTTVTTAAGRDSLLTIGLSLFAVAVIHNTTGYGLGYLLSRLLGLDKQSARAMALEVGLQNGGMASGIAGSMGLLGTLGLASAVFSPWMNISGSLLANYWKNKSPTSPP